MIGRKVRSRETRHSESPNRPHRSLDKYERSFYKNVRMNTNLNQPDRSDVTPKSPREALLDTAEALFATGGFEGVSLRQLTQAAGTNLAAVNYHFGSKEAFFTEVLARRLRPINARRLELLEAVLTRAGDSAPKLEEVLDAFARPFFEVLEGAADPDVADPLRRTMARVLMEADSIAIPLFEKELLPVARQFGQAVSRVRPDLPFRRIALGLMFFAGSMVSVLASRNRLRALGPTIGGVPDDKEVLTALIRHGAAGMFALADPQSPPSPDSTSSDR